MSHVRVITESLPAYDGEASMNFLNHVLYIGARGRYVLMQPQFVIQTVDGWSYSPQMTPHTRGFIGWLPYFNKRWPTGSGKAAFKRLCLDNAIPTPRAWAAAQQAESDFILKAEKGSFARGISGPYRREQARTQDIRVPEGSYCEEFIRGRIAKIWYWDGIPACLELHEMPRITGNGVDTVEALLKRAVTSNVGGFPPSRESLRIIAQFQGFDLESVLPAGQSMLADFRYGSAFIPRYIESTNVMKEHVHGPLGEQLSRYGAMFWNSIPEETRPQTAFSVDAILDNDGKFWFLEMNCNPALHPEIYGPMLTGLFGQPMPTPPGGWQRRPSPLLAHLAAPAGYSAANGLVPFPIAPPPMNRPMNQA